MLDFNLLDRFFNPKSIALIGASRKPYGAANTLLSGVLHKKYEGDIYLINNSAVEGKKIHGLPVYRSILDCPKVDLVFIIVPSRHVKSVIEDCVELGITNGVIISAGFKESILYDKSKVELERQIVEFARTNGLRLIGPNCNGIINIPTSFYAFFGPRLKVNPGGISYVTRGGTAGGFILMGSASPGRSLGINKLLNIGDACDLTVGEFIQYYEQDATTEIIGVYTEGITHGSKLLQILKNTTKPIIFYKSGQTFAGQRAALSHVGAIASTNTNQIYQGFISQAGVIPVNGIEEMLDMAIALKYSSLPLGKKVGIFTFGGSIGVMMTDAAAKHGIDVAPLKPSQIEVLNKLLPEYWSHSNPVDVTDGGSAFETSGLFKILSILLEEYDCLFIVAPVFEHDEIFDYAETEMNIRNVFREMVKQTIRRYKRLVQAGKPIFVLGEYGEISELFLRNGIPVYNSFEGMAKAYMGLYRFSQILKQKGLFEEYQQKKIKEKAPNKI